MAIFVATTYFSGPAESFAMENEGIRQVIRGEEHLSNTPKQQLLWEALGADLPVWGHLPVIVNEKRQKLCKRRDKVALRTTSARASCPRRWCTT